MRREQRGGVDGHRHGRGVLTLQHHPAECTRPPLGAAGDDLPAAGRLSDQGMLGGVRAVLRWLRRELQGHAAELPLPQFAGCTRARRWTHPCGLDAAAGGATDVPRAGEHRGRGAGRQHGAPKVTLVVVVALGMGSRSIRCSCSHLSHACASAAARCDRLQRCDDRSQAVPRGSVHVSGCR